MNPSLQVFDPEKFRMREVLIINTIGVVPGAILGLSGVGGLSLWVGALLTGERMLLALGLAALAICGAVLFFLPAFLGNAYVRCIVRGTLQQNVAQGLSYICQVSFSPRLHGGFRGFMEDADDVGHLQMSDEAVIFTGDHVRLCLPFEYIKEVSHSNCGYRGLWIVGQRINITTDSLENCERFELLERQSNTVISSRSTSTEIIHELARRTQPVGLRVGSPIPPPREGEGQAS